jgi:hypothetical protein
MPPAAPAAPPAAPPTPPTPPPQHKEQVDFQLRWSDAEVSRIAAKIQTDYRAAISDHNRRMRRWREYYRRWRASVDAPPLGEETGSNLPVPMIRWNVFTKLAKEVDALFGDDAEIVAVPVGPSDYRRDKKIGRYMTWRCFSSMKLLNPFCEFVLRKLIFGKSFAFSPWKRDTYEVAGKEIVDYEGPGFEPLWPDDIIVPAEEVRTIHDFSYVIRRVRVTPDDLLRGEREGRYQNIKKNWTTILNLAQHGTQRDFEGEDIKLEKDEAEGVLYERPLSSGEWITILEYYGKWRPLKSGKRDAGEWDFDRREMLQREFVFRWLKDLNLVVGIQSLEDLYPTMRFRRPFVESSMCKDGTYWSPGLCEMLIEMEDDLRVNHNLGTESAQFAATPMFGYRPASGVTADTFRAQPGLFIPLDNPATDLREIPVTANLNAITWKEQAVLAYVEKLTGMSDLQMGRQSDRPNAPRTATQTVHLLEEGNVRISLDTKVLQEDMSAILQHFWQLEYLFTSPDTFFRVTEEDADGLFPVNNGASVLSLEDRDGRFDFRLKFANSVWSKEVKKQEALALYTLDLQNPLVVQNPRALWNALQRAHEALGDPNIADTIPEPPEPDISIDPKVEWARMQEGEEIQIHAADDDRVHISRHYSDWQKSTTDPNRDPEAVKALEAHYAAHISQLQSKVLQQAIVEHAVALAEQTMQSGKPPAQPGGVLAFPSGLWGPHSGVAKGPRDTTTGPAGNPTAQNPGVFPLHPEIQHEQ